MQIFKNANFDFVGIRKYGAIFSLSLILIGFISLILKGGPRYGIDFEGGTSIRIQFEKPIEVGTIRNILSGIGFGNSEIKNIGEKNEILVKIEQQPDIGRVSDLILNEINSKIQNNKSELRERETVGPRIGSELRRSMIWAILAAMALILIYISWRFEYIFAVGAVIALFHDVFITLGVFSVLNLEITLAVIAAFLTIIGYSLNDTIVVFDRIRENIKIMRREKYEKIINDSINQTLSRTVLTGSTTLIVLFILYFFGGEVIHDFSFALLFGIIIGTYSSIFIASPIVIEWHIRQESKKSRSLSHR